MDEKTGISPEEFKINHLKQRVADITMHYEDMMATGAVQLQFLAQERDELKQQLREALGETSGHREETNRLISLCVEHNIDVGVVPAE